MSSSNKKHLQAQRTISHQDKIIDVLKEQVNCLQAEVLNIMRILADSEDTSKNDHEKKMDVDVTNTSEPLGNASCAALEWDIDWDREEDLVYKEILVFERDLAKKAKKEFQDLKNKPLQGMAPTECLPSLAYLLACLLTCLPACLLTCLPAYLPACLLAYLPAYLLACPRTPLDSLERC